MPVALNLYEIREATDEGGELFRQVRRQVPQYQGIWIVAPDGQVLAAHHDVEDRTNWSAEILATIEQATDAFAPLEPRRRPAQPRPGGYGQGVQPCGGVQLAVSTRFMRGGDRREGLPDWVSRDSLWLWNGQLRRDGPVVFDGIDLSAEQWNAWAPPEPQSGTVWQLPAEVADLFYRLLSPISDQTHLRGHRLTRSRLEARVEAVVDGQAHLRLTGQWELDQPDEQDRPVRAWCSADGVAIYDVDRQEMVSLLLVGHGAFGRPQTRPTGAVVRWTASEK